MTSYAHQIETSPSLGGYDRRNCRHFRELLGGPAQWCPTHIISRPRHPWGAVICETVATFEGCWRAQWSEAPPRIQIRTRQPWAAAICETAATFEGFWEVRRR